MDSTEALAESLDRLERLTAAKEAEIRRLRSELELSEMLVRELRTLLREHQERFEVWEQRLSRLEAGIIPNRPPSSLS